MDKDIEAVLAEILAILVEIRAQLAGGNFPTYIPVPIGPYPWNEPVWTTTKIGTTHAA